MLQFQLRTLFAMAAVCAAFFFGWRLDSVFHEFHIATAILVAAITCSTGIVLVFGGTRILRWLYASFAVSAIVFTALSGSPENLTEVCGLALFSFAPTALVCSLVLVVWEQGVFHVSTMPCQRWVPWLSLFLNTIVFGLIAHLNVLAGTSRRFNELMEFAISTSLVLPLVVVLIKGGWRILPWCTLVFANSVMIPEIMSDAGFILSTVGNRSDIAVWSCVPAAILGGGILLWQRRQAARASAN